MKDVDRGSTKGGFGAGETKGMVVDSVMKWIDGKGGQAARQGLALNASVHT